MAIPQQKPILIKYNSFVTFGKDPISFIYDEQPSGRYFREDTEAKARYYSEAKKIILNIIYSRITGEDNKIANALHEASPDDADIKDSMSKGNAFKQLAILVDRAQDLQVLKDIFFRLDPVTLRILTSDRSFFGRYVPLKQTGCQGCIVACKNIIEKVEWLDKLSGMPLGINITIFPFLTPPIIVSQVELLEKDNQLNEHGKQIRPIALERLQEIDKIRLEVSKVQKDYVSVLKPPDLKLLTLLDLPSLVGNNSNSPVPGNH